MVYCRMGSGGQGGKVWLLGVENFSTRNYDCGGQSSRHGRNRTSCYSHGDPYYDDCDCDRDSNQDHVHVQDYDRDRGWD
ncbi:1300_t:CDS:2 [Entrophospora sp. SA101]|nr:1300_t:CDS:2 [Entrophospora sp. SA101]